MFPYCIIEDFLNSYLARAVYSSCIGQSSRFTTGDFTPSARTQAEQECRRFLMLNREWSGRWSSGEAHSAGRDFWLTRNSHGSGFGFLDGYWKNPVEAQGLAKSSRRFGPSSVEVVRRGPELKLAFSSSYPYAMGGHGQYWQSALGKRRAVKNLSWLLRNNHLVRTFEILPGIPTNEGTERIALRANLRGGGFFMTDYPDLSVLLLWLDRKVFRGLPVTFRAPVLAGYRNWITHTGDITFHVGTEDYRSI